MFDFSKLRFELSTALRMRYEARVSAQPADARLAALSIGGCMRRQLVERASSVSAPAGTPSVPSRRA